MHWILQNSPHFQQAPNFSSEFEDDSDEHHPMEYLHTLDMRCCCCTSDLTEILVSRHMAHKKLRSIRSAKEWPSMIQWRYRNHNTLREQSLCSSRSVSELVSVSPYRAI